MEFPKIIQIKCSNPLVCLILEAFNPNDMKSHLN